MRDLIENPSQFFLAILVVGLAISLATSMFRDVIAPSDAGRCERCCCAACQSEIGAVPKPAPKPQPK